MLERRLLARRERRDLVVGNSRSVVGDLDVDPAGAVRGGGDADLHRGDGGVVVFDRVRQQLTQRLLERDVGEHELRLREVPLDGHLGLRLQPRELVLKQLDDVDGLSDRVSTDDVLRLLDRLREAAEVVCRLVDRRGGVGVGPVEAVFQHPRVTEDHGQVVPEVVPDEPLEDLGLLLPLLAFGYLPDRQDVVSGSVHLDRGGHRLHGDRRAVVAAVLRLLSPRFAQHERLPVGVERPLTQVLEGLPDVCGLDVVAGPPQQLRVVIVDVLEAPGVAVHRQPDARLRERLPEDPELPLALPALADVAHGADRSPEPVVVRQQGQLDLDGRFRPAPAPYRPFERAAHSVRRHQEIEDASLGLVDGLVRQHRRDVATAELVRPVAGRLGERLADALDVAVVVDDVELVADRLEQGLVLLQLLRALRSAEGRRGVHREELHAAGLCLSERVPVVARDREHPVLAERKREERRGGPLRFGRGAGARSAGGPDDRLVGVHRLPHRIGRLPGERAPVRAIEAVRPRRGGERSLAVVAPEVDGVQVVPQHRGGRLRDDLRDPIARVRAHQLLGRRQQLPPDPAVAAALAHVPLTP